MKIRIHVSPPRPDYMMIELTPDEALELAESLVRQVRTDDPNTRRPEVLVREGDFKGRVSLVISHERCLECGKDVPGHELGRFKAQKGGVLCSSHETYREREERAQEERRRSASAQAREEAV